MEPPVVETPVVEPVVEKVKKTRKPRAKKVTVAAEGENEVEVEVKKVKKVKKVKDPNAPKKIRKPNAWLTHVADYRAKHPDVAYKQVLTLAKESYVKPTKV
jgi:hypothetical protein